MKKMLVPGDDNKLMRYKKFECTNCGCVFIASHDDYDNHSTQHDGTMFRSVCMHCNASVWNYSLEYYVEEN